MVRWLSTLLFVLSLPLYAFDETELARRTSAHIKIQDPGSAIIELEVALASQPRSETLLNTYIKATAALGDEAKMMEAWQKFATFYPGKEYDPELLEAMAWGSIQNGAKSTTVLTRNMSLIAALLSRDVKGVAILHAAMQDTSALIRTVAILLASQLPDEKLQKEIVQRFRFDKAYSCRMAALKAIGTRRIKAARPLLERHLLSDILSDEERGATLQSLVQITEGAEPAEIAKLAKSTRATHRLLACALVQRYDLHTCIDMVIPLLQDRHPDVRMAALLVLGTLRPQIPLENYAKSCLQDREKPVAITAAWLLTLCNPPLGQQALGPYLFHEEEKVRHLASGALKATGKHGYPLVSEALCQTKDPYVHINLALSLVAERKDPQLGCRAIYTCLDSLQKELLMWEDTGAFRYVTKSTLHHRPDIPRFPESSDLLTRLELLNVLATLEFEGVQQALLSFIQKKEWTVTGIAASLLLAEGDEEAKEQVRALLTHSEEKVRLQAALLLALWGHDETALQTLENAYATQERAQKERILEALGSIASRRSIPFLASCLQEPQQHLRIIAASSLLQALAN